MHKIKSFFRSSNYIGYIIVTTEYGSVIRINSRAILRYYPYCNQFLDHTNTRLIYLDNHFENIREDSNLIDAQIAELSR